MTDATVLKTGVVGAGNMGRHHARVYASHAGAEFVGVHDVDSERAAAIADQYDGKALDLEDLLDRVDAVSVAVPTRYHHEVASEAMERGVDVLVEKPLAKDPEKCRDLIAIAERTGTVLQVGHVERFNPAVAAVMDVVPDLDVVAVEARRLGPPVDRDSTDSVALDLMIHDLDVVTALLDEEVADISAERARDGKYVNARLTYDSGTVAQFTASRLTQRKIRQLSITAKECYITVDFADQDVYVHRHSVPEYVPTNGDVKYRHESIIEQPVVESGEPLEREIDSFLTTIREGDEPAVTGADGLRALELALAIDEGRSVPAETPAQHPTQQ